MKRNAILDTIRSMAATCGAHGRLYNFLSSGSYEAEETLQELEAQNFADPMDLIFAIEC